MPRSIDLVVFDLGRVLVRICDGWQHACAVAGVAAAPRGELSAEAYARVHATMCAHEVGEIDVDGFARAAAPHLGVSHADFVAMHNAYTRGLYPGAAQLLDDLRAAGVKTACLSNTNASHWGIMSDPAHASFVPFDKFDRRFASHLLRARKPDDRIYAHVEQATGVAPGRIVFFDDVEENVAAAARRGWHAHRIALDRNPVAQVREHLQRHEIL
jgi:HAD superfamily hydrolase (TIGR01509 family)